MAKKIETLEQYTERFKKLYKDAKELDCYGILGKLHDSERHEISGILTRLDTKLFALRDTAVSLAVWCENRINDTYEKARAHSDDKIRENAGLFASYNTELTACSENLRKVLDTIHVDSNASTGKCSASDIITILDYCTKTLPNIVKNRLDYQVTRAKDNLSEVVMRVRDLQELGPEQVEIGKLILNYVKGYQAILQKLQAITVELSNLTTDVLESLKNIINKN